MNKINKLSSIAVLLFLNFAVNNQTINAMDMSSREDSVVSSESDSSVFFSEVSSHDSEKHKKKRKHRRMSSVKRVFGASKADSFGGYQESLEDFRKRLLSFAEDLEENPLTPSVGNLRILGESSNPAFEDFVMTDSERRSGKNKISEKKNADSENEIEENEIESENEEEKVVQDDAITDEKVLQPKKNTKIFGIERRTLKKIGLISAGTAAFVGVTGFFAYKFIKHDSTDFWDRYNFNLLPAPEKLLCLPPAPAKVSTAVKITEKITEKVSQPVCFVNPETAIDYKNIIANVTDKCCDEVFLKRIGLTEFCGSGTTAGCDYIAQNQSFFRRLALGRNGVFSKQIPLEEGVDPVSYGISLGASTAFVLSLINKFISLF